MKKIALASVLAVGVVGVSIALQSAQSSTLNSYTKSLALAESASVRMTGVVVGGGRSPYSIDLAKPNKARLETPSMLMVSNGEEIVTVMKQQRVYLRTPFSAQKLNAAMVADEFNLFRPFFQANALDSMGMIRDLPSVSRRGETLNVVQGVMDATSGKVAKLSIGSDNLLRVGEISTPKGGSVIFDVDSFSLNATSASRFEFKAPAGFKEVTEADLAADRWYSNIEEAKTIAKQTNRLVLIDFMFDGCVWCARLDADVFSTSEFKEKAKGFVLAKVDILKDPSQAEPYNVAGAPDIRFIKPDGTEVGRIGGYVPLAQFLSKMDAALAGQ